MNDPKPHISIAPMMSYTDRHFRYLIRLLSKHILLYSEMVPTQAILGKNSEQYLAFSTEEHPVALQLGGSDPKQLAQCASIAQNYGYDEVNLNVGCPSPRVQAAEFGACLFKRPEHVAQCVSAMTNAVSIPVTVKTRIGVDDCDQLDDLYQFIDKVSQTGCKTFIIHARKAWLKGLSPRANRHIPPLQYDVVYQLKKIFPQLTIIINGGINSNEAIQSHLSHVDGVMIGRKACDDPYWLAQFDQRYFHDTQPLKNRDTIYMLYCQYMAKQLNSHKSKTTLIKPLFNLYHAMPGAKKWRQRLNALQLPFNQF